MIITEVFAVQRHGIRKPSQEAAVDLNLHDVR
jgi:hypothetical protein